jgi:hypothetical protein
MKITSLLMTAFCFVSISCDQKQRRQNAEYQKKLLEMLKSGVVAGPGEKTFEENQSVSLHLPMPESEFLALLQRTNLRFERTGEQSGIIPKPWHNDSLDLSRIEKAYQIYGKTDPKRHVAEGYRAYVDKSGEVIYLENMFIYTDAP